MIKIKKRAGLWVLVFLLLLAAFLRLNRIRGFATFLGDEGRDALVVKRMLVDGKPTLLGPSTSVGDLFLGPIYYYMMLPALWVSNLDPVGPAVMVALIGVATVWLIWRAGSDFFGPRAGFKAALLYALSQPVIEHTRFSWNPNPMPFFGLLSVWSVYKATKTGKWFWAGLAGACLGLCVQLHYLGLGLVVGVIGLMISLRPRIGWRGWTAFVGAGLLLVSPILMFELRHDWLITNGLIRFLTHGDKLGLSLVVWVQRSLGAFWRLIYHFLAMDRAWLAVVVLLVTFCWWRSKKTALTEPLGRKVMLIWLGLGLAVVGLYSGDLHDHYLGFLFPAPFILVGAWFEKRSWVRFWGRLVFVLLLIVNILNLDLVAGRAPDNQIERARQVGESIAASIEPEEKFNLAPISPTFDFRALNYRYFTELAGRPAEGFENYSDIDTLFIIIEGKDLRAVGVTAWEIDSFGESELVDEWQFEFGYRVEKWQKRSEDHG